MKKLCQRVHNRKTEPRNTANPIPIIPKSFKEAKSIGLRDLRALCKDAWTCWKGGLEIVCIELGITYKDLRGRYRR